MQLTYQECESPGVFADSHLLRPIILSTVYVSESACPVHVCVFMCKLFELFNFLSLPRPPADDCWPWLNITVEWCRGHGKKKAAVPKSEREGTDMKMMSVKLDSGLWFCYK